MLESRGGFGGKARWKISNYAKCTFYVPIYIFTRQIGR